MLTPETDLSTALALQGINRRQLVKFCSAMLGMLALPERYLAQTVAAVGKAKKEFVSGILFDAKKDLLYSLDINKASLDVVSTKDGKTISGRRMNEDTFTSLSQIVEGVVLQHVVPERNKSGRPCVHNECAALRQKPFHQQIEFALVHASIFQEFQAAHCQTPVFGQRLIHWVGINAVHILPSRQ